MLLPTKGVSADRALMTVGCEILEELHTPMTVTALWDRYRRRTISEVAQPRITFDWFALALAFLYATRLLEASSEGYLVRSNVH